MTTVLEEYTTEEQRYVVRLCGQNDSMQSIFIKKYILLIVGSVCRVKQFTTGLRKVANVSVMTKGLKRRCGSGWNNSQKFLCCEFRCTGIAMEQVYQCWWRICLEINVFSRFEYYMLYVLYPSVTYLLTLPLIMWLQENWENSLYAESLSASGPT
jgi:hypothetical protein